MSNRIEYNGFSFADAQILGGSCFIGESITGDSLAIDTLEVTVYWQGLQGEMVATGGGDGFALPDGSVLQVCPAGTRLTDYTYGAPVLFYHDDVLVGRFYLESITQASTYGFTLSCVSAVGILDNVTHYGGMYSGAAVSAVAADIIGSAVPYSVDAEVASVPVYGWLPVATCRENLHQLLFAVGASLRKDTAGALVISFLSGETSAEIAPSRLFTGGSVAYNTPATEAQVTEHGYAALSADDSTTLFDNTDGSGAVTSRVVTFSSPCHDLVASGLTIEESGVNYAIVSGTGTLTGQTYTHTTRVISASAESTSGLTGTVSVTDATLVSVANSQNVAERLLAYHSTARTVTMGLVVGTERPGDLVSLVSPFGIGCTGIIRQMDIALSGMLRAETVFVTDYTPVGIGNYYTASLLISTSGTYSLYALGIPLDKTRLRIVCIGGGSGGTSGTDGEDGTQEDTKTETSSISGASITYADGGDGGAGGDAGTAGDGGSIYVTTVTITSASSITVSAGAAGASDTAGGATTCTIDGTAYTSASGAVSALGYTDTLTGVTYAGAGADGTAGADGGAGGGSYSGEDLAQDGTAGDDVDTATGGTGGIAGGEQSGRGWGGADGASGGGGGGAAYKTNGTGGGSATFTWSGTSVTAMVTGAGGAGASPPAGASGATWGCGGSGGHGGGGGGGAGGFLAKAATYTYADAGAGGTGSSGGKGGAGCVIIYY